MPTNELHDSVPHSVKRIMEIGHGDSHGIHEETWGVNEYLEEGWVLLEILVNRVADPVLGERKDFLTYILGWTDENDPPSDRAKEESKRAGMLRMEEMGRRMLEELGEE